MNLSFLGGGSWATTLGIILSERFKRIKLWEINEERIKKIEKRREIPEFLPEVKIPEKLEYSSNLFWVIEDADFLVLAVPSHALRSILKKLPKDYRPKKGVVSGIKGIEVDTKKRMSEVWKEFFSYPIAVLSGPSIAREVVKNMPTTLVSASEDISLAQELQHQFSINNLRIYTSKDVVGVELGGALKNIVAIAAGISDGLGFKTNTKGALLIRGLAEIVRLGVKLGADPSTLSGLSGVGDMITTSFSEYSRNRYVGYRLGRGEKINDILKDMQMVAEGVNTTKAVKELAEELKVEMPITNSVYRIIYKGSSPLEELKKLLARPLKEEIW